MTVELKVFEGDNTTFVADVQTFRRVVWMDELLGAGWLSFEFSAGEEVSTSLVRADRIVRVRVDGVDMFAGSVAQQAKSRTDVDPALVQVECVGLRAMLDTAVCYPEGGLSALQPGTRLFGWQSDLFSHLSWTFAASHGQWDTDPFGDGRPDGWPVPTAQLIWSATGSVAAGDVYFFKQFTMSDDDQVTVCAAADDEYDLYLDGVLILSSRGPGKWNTVQQFTVPLAAGDHWVAVRGTNLLRPYGDSPAWILVGVVPADADGQPAGTAETFTVHRGTASGGTFTLTEDGRTATAAIAWDASAATVEAALEAVAGSVGWTVTGTGTSGDPWQCVADDFAAHTLTGDGTSLTPSDTLTIANTVDGTYPDVYLRSQTTWRVLAYPATAPGMTPGNTLASLVSEATARGALPWASVDFTGAVDSSSTAWAGQVELAVPVGTGVGAVVAMLEDAGSVCHVLADGTVRLWDPANVGTDVSATVQAVYEGNVKGCLHRRDALRFDRLLVQTASGWHEVEAVTPGSPQREGLLTLGTTPSQAASKPITDRVLGEFGEQADITEVGVAQETGGLQPGVDFTVGDLVGATNWGRDVTVQRVVSVAGTVDDASGQVDWTVELADTGVVV